MNCKQRIHSAELRRLDHIARSLDRIGDAIERLHEIVVSGNNNRIIDVAGDIKGRGCVSQNISQSVGRDGSNTDGSNTFALAGDNSAAAAGSGVATVNSSGATQNFNDEVSGSNMPMGDIKHLPHNPGMG